MAIIVYQHKGYDGKVKQFVYGTGYYPFILRKQVYYYEYDNLYAEFNKQ
jgi:hypothetical protein